MVFRYTLSAWMYDEKLIMLLNISFDNGEHFLHFGEQALNMCTLYRYTRCACSLGNSLYYPNMIKSIFAITKPTCKQTDRNRVIFSCWHLQFTRRWFCFFFFSPMWREHCYLWVNSILTEDSFEKTVDAVGGWFGISLKFTINTGVFSSFTFLRAT